MEFVKEFATFLHQSGIIRFGDFTLASGKKSSYYVDLRIVPSYPHQFRRMIKYLQNLISEQIGFDSFDAVASVPTGGLVIASALALETVKPLVYVRSEAKSHGTGKLIEGIVEDGMKILLVDDVATTGGSIINGIKALKEAGAKISDCYVIVNRMEGAHQALQMEGVTLHQVLDISEIAEILHQARMISEQTLKKVHAQTSSQ
ncbi:orotate phosphoribosyltransferase [Candidatus Nitrosotenuis uzonensis]|uniref:Orotate phosphoribosyltransferase n=1 Tax=Candidatus Nitrosotenuis uzonensis TaxID=1407055 RepID=V6AUP7_9ARCH|nr:orotate phosphoribosyltransferase [Candidatus Nitrosotenuis uzonensis]CDI06235.1 Orotate phosphoribosyltransferase [Candidatus Nitrosotenuis uzonensis]